VVSKVFAPTPRTQKAEIIQTQSDQPGDLAATLLAKMFTKFPQLRAGIGPRVA